MFVKYVSELVVVGGLTAKRRGMVKVFVTWFSEADCIRSTFDVASRNSLFSDSSVNVVD